MPQGICDLLRLIVLRNQMNGPVLEYTGMHPDTVTTVSARIKATMTLVLMFDMILAPISWRLRSSAAMSSGAINAGQRARTTSGRGAHTHQEVVRTRMTAGTFKVGTLRKRAR